MRITLAAAAIVAALILVAPATAATTLGSSGTALASSCGGDVIAWQTDGQYVVPAGGGIITSMATHSPSATGQMSLKVVSGSTIVGTSELFTIGAGENRVAMHVPVSGGEFLGFYGINAACAVSSGSGGTVTGASPAGGDPPVGTTVATTSSTPAALAIEATLEPDADHDGFGDDSEDSCPADPAIHAGACQADVGVTQSVVPTKIGLGDVAVATVTFKNASAGTANGLALGATLSPGLQLVSMFPSVSCVLTPALSCPLGALATGSSTVAALVVKGTAVGEQTITSSGTTSSTDPNAANNTVASAVTVEKRAAVVCTVPKLTGLTKSFAKTLLAAVHCKLGKATKKKARKGKRGTVIKQSKKAKSVLPAGTRVNVTLRN